MCVVSSELVRVFRIQWFLKFSRLSPNTMEWRVDVCNTQEIRFSFDRANKRRPKRLPLFFFYHFRVLNHTHFGRMSQLETVLFRILQEIAWTHSRNVSTFVCVNGSSPRLETLEMSLCSSKGILQALCNVSSNNNILTQSCRSRVKVVDFLYCFFLALQIYRLIVTLHSVTKTSSYDFFWFWLVAKNFKSFCD